MTKIECPLFQLGETITSEQLEFFDKNGIIIFRKFLPKETVALILKEILLVEQKWLSEGVQKVNGIPLKFGKDENGEKMIQRMPFVSMHSKMLSDFFNNSLIKNVTGLLNSYEGRIGEDEKDGLVVSNYINIPNSKLSQLGWHTDSPRDLFLGQRIMPMLNVGLHLDDCPFENGGLRVLPGTHKQGIFKLLFGKKYFIDNNPDPNEGGFDIEAGDLTIHDGRIWHRVQQSPLFGKESQRRVMYIPVVTGKYKPKNDKSPTPFYHKLAIKTH